MKNITQLVDDTMKSLDAVERPAANPYLYTRIMQRMQNRSVVPAAHHQKMMPVLAIVLVLFISINVVSYFRVSNNNTQSNQPAAGNIESFASEYNLSEETGL